MVKVYHGTTRKFKEFDSIHLGGATKSRSARFGFWFTDDIETAKSYAREENNAKVNELIRAGKVEEASRLEDKIFNNTDTKYLKTISLSYNNPLTIDADGRQYNDYSEEIIDAIKQAVDNKNDVLIVKNLSDHADYSEYRPSTHYLVLDNTIIEQSKPDLKFELGGLYHGSPYDFNKFTTKEVGSGEGNQSFGWGLYFTDVKDIAKRYALSPNENSFYINGISLKDSSLTQEEKDIILGIWREIWELGYAEDKDDFIKEIKYSIGNKAMLLDENDDSVFDKETIIDLNKSALIYIKINDLFSYADIDIKPNIYNVTIHKGKSPDQYDWLLLDKPVSESQIERILKKSKDEGFIKSEKDLNWFKIKTQTGGLVYDWLRERHSNQGGYHYVTKSSDKSASLFLLGVGIDGIKYPSNNYGGVGDGFNYIVFDENAIDIETKDTFSKGGEVAKNKETYKKWKSLVNMSKGELEKFYNSQEGKDAGLSSQEASEQGISSGRESARWIMKMKDTNVSDWTPSMWRWANKQISFISRMSGNKGSLYDDKGDKTRKHTSLLIWGHNPKKNKFDLGGLLAPQKMPTFIAPNGNRSNLLHIKEIGKDDRWVYLYDIVRTREFKEWFGDWEEAYKTKDYEGVSKIIDENGEPSICYHTTNDDFFEFNENFIGGKTDKGYYGRGFYFTEGSADSHYGQREVPCFLNIRNPYLKQSSYKTYELDTEDLKSKGYDGVIVFSGDIKNIDLSKGLGYDSNRVDEIVAYNPEDIKLADATNTAFDKYDSDIRYKNGGQAFNDKELLSKWKRGESIGFTATSHLKAKGLIPRADGTKRKSEKYIFDSGGNAMNVEVKLVKGNDLSDKVLDLVLNTDELGAVGQPRLALLENGNVIGGIFLEPPNSYSLNGKYVVETYWEYKFDIIIERSKRKKGYSKILLDAMIKDFVDNFPDADKIRGEVINKKLQKSLEKYYGFSCDSRNEENITYCYLSKDDAVKFKYADGGQTPYVSDDFQIGYDGAYENLLAPNGQPSNLTPEQYRLVRTPAFKKWFGDWENDPDNASKVVDENGEPLVVYHGTKEQFNEFDIDKVGVHTDSGMFGRGFYFSNDFNYANTYANRGGNNGVIIYSFLKIINPLFINSKIDIPEMPKPKTIEQMMVADKIYSKNFRDYLINKKYDGVISKLGYKNIKLGEYVALYPYQIKLADGTNTTFDSNNPDIRYVNGGNIPKFDIKSREGEEDRTTISLKGIGEVILVETFPEYEFTEDVDEYTLNDLGLSEGDMIGKIEHIEIKDEYKGKGYAKLLIKKAIELAKEKGLMPLYLNASPMGSKRYGLSLEDLTGFYESFGFKVFLNQGNNNLMILKEDVKFKNGGKVKVEPMSFPTFVDLDNSFPIDKGYRWADWQDINTPTEMNKVFKHYNIPLKAKKNLGKGLFGYAFLTDKDTVVKITNYSNEAFASFVIMQKGNLLKTQAKVFKMYKITNGSRSLYIIEKEYIPQVLENSKYDLRILSLILEFAKKVSNIRFVDGNPYSDKELYEKAREYYQSNYETREYYQSNYGSEDEMIGIIYKILKFYIDIEKDERAVNLDFDDIHTGNIGFKDDKLLCFDCAMTENTELKSGGMVN